MKRMRDLHAQDRPREKIALKGASSLSDSELISAIIGKGTRNRDVFEIARDIRKIIAENPESLGYQDLAVIEGVGPTKASQILASFELARRYLAPPGERRRVHTPEDLLPEVEFLKKKKQEHFICTTLNGANEVIATRIITVGLLNHSLVHPREVFADAVTDRAAAVICTHNHPSGTLEPSSQDIAITRQLADAGSLLGIRLLDHLIICDSGYMSMKERGML